MKAAPGSQAAPRQGARTRRSAAAHSAKRRGSTGAAVSGHALAAADHGRPVRTADAIQHDVSRQDVSRQQVLQQQATRENPAGDAASSAALDLERYLPYLINRVAVAFVQDFTRGALAEHDLTIGMWRVLAALSERGAQRQIDLATMTSIETSTLSRLVSRLQAMRLVTRRRSQASSREVIVALTKQGHAVLERLVPSALRMQEEACKAIPPQTLALVQQALRTIYANMAPAAGTDPTALD